MKHTCIVYFITQVFFFTTALNPAIAKLPNMNRPSLSDASNQITTETSRTKTPKEDIRKTVCTKSIRSNFRKGPDTNSPIEYEVLVRGYPLKVIKFIDTWYATEDFEGNIAWISQINVKQNCGAIVSSSSLTSVYFAPSVKSKVILSLQKGFIIHSVECLTPKWCSVKINEKTGWVLKENLWGNVGEPS